MRQLLKVPSHLMEGHETSKSCGVFYLIFSPIDKEKKKKKGISITTIHFMLFNQVVETPNGVEFHSLLLKNTLCLSRVHNPRAPKTCHKIPGKKNDPAN